MNERVRWSWAASMEEADTWRAEARKLVGRRVERVRYFDIDYRAEDYRRDEVGPRTIESEAEWSDPSWAYPACDSIDYAVEFETADGKQFTISWDSPGMMEGLGLRELPAIGSAFRADADVAVWDVSDAQQWSTLCSVDVRSVEMHYERWGESGEAQWCSWISIGLGSRVVEFVLGEGDRTNDRVLPSSDTVAVIFDRRFMPSWLTDRH